VSRGLGCVLVWSDFCMTLDDWNLGRLPSLNSGGHDTGVWLGSEQYGDDHSTVHGHVLSRVVSRSLARYSKSTVLSLLNFNTKKKLCQTVGSPINLLYKLWTWPMVFRHFPLCLKVKQRLRTLVNPPPHPPSPTRNTPDENLLLLLLLLATLRRNQISLLEEPEELRTRERRCRCVKIWTSKEM
jgi:hypothetical protein